MTEMYVGADDPQLLANETDKDTLYFFGSSDDLIYVGVNNPQGTYECYPNSEERASFTVAGLRISVNYTTNGVWGIEVERDDDSMITASNARLEVDGYTMRLSVDVPKGSPLHRVEGSGDLDEPVF